jgi:hypothetical protein
MEGCSRGWGGGVGSVWCPQKLQRNPRFGAAREAYSLPHICQDRRIVVATDGSKGSKGEMGRGAGEGKGRELNGKG